MTGKDAKVRRSTKTTATVEKSAAPYVRTPREQEGVTAFKARQAAALPFPKIKLTPADNGVAQLSSDHADEAVAQALQLNAMGLVRSDEFAALVKDIANLTGKNGAVDEAVLNEMLALIVGIGPTNTTEAMLAVQMAAVHRATITSALRLRIVDQLDQAAVHVKALNALARTFAMQAETLKKLRSTGEQRVVVEHQHVHVHPGGQAVVGTLNQGVGGGGQTENEDQPHVRSLSERPSMLCNVETLRPALPWTGGEGLERVPVPRSERRGAGGAG